MKTAQTTVKGTANLARILPVALALVLTLAAVVAVPAPVQAASSGTTHIYVKGEDGVVREYAPVAGADQLNEEEPQALELTQAQPTETSLAQDSSQVIDDEANPLAAPAHQQANVVSIISARSTLFGAMLGCLSGVGLMLVGSLTRKKREEDRADDWPV